MNTTVDQADFFRSLAEKSGARGLRGYKAQADVP
jgi:hypothetical protein